MVFNMDFMDAMGYDSFGYLKMKYAHDHCRKSSDSSSNFWGTSGSNIPI
jgi:hypothetical protein